MSDTEKIIPKVVCQEVCILPYIGEERIGGVFVYCTSVFKWNGSCKKCNHSSRFHKKTSFEYREMPENLEVKRLKELQDEIQEITNRYIQFRSYLKKNSIIPFNVACDAIDRHMEYFLRQERSKTPHNQSAITKLMEIMERYQSQKDATLKEMEQVHHSDLESGDVEKLVQKLYGLKHNGESIKNNLEKMNKESKMPFETTEPIPYLSYRIKKDSTKTYRPFGKRALKY